MIPDFPHNTCITLKKKCCALTLISLSLAFLNWDSQQASNLAMSERNKQTFPLRQSYSYIIRKVWYHQIWIQNNLGFKVLILIKNAIYCQVLQCQSQKLLRRLKQFDILNSGKWLHGFSNKPHYETKTSLMLLHLTTIGGPWYFWKGICVSKAHKPVTLSGNPTFTKV